MEKEGLRRCIDNLCVQNVVIKTIIIDRHVQIMKWIRENLSDTEHKIDAWHVAKGNFSLSFFNYPMVSFALEG